MRFPDEAQSSGTRCTELTRSARFQLLEQRIVAREHVVELGDRDRLRAVLAQEIRQRVDLLPAGNAASACRTRSARRTAPRRRSAPSPPRAARRRSRQSACAPRGRRARGPARRCGRGSGARSRSSPSRQSALRAATRLACERRIMPSSMTFSPLAASVVPVVVMSTMSSAVPAAGAPSVAPRLSTMR